MEDLPQGLLNPGNEQPDYTMNHDDEVGTEPPAPAAALPANWREVVSAEGETFYFNAATDTSQWEAPTTSAPAPWSDVVAWNRLTPEDKEWYLARMAERAKPRPVKTLIPPPPPAPWADVVAWNRLTPEDKEWYLARMAERAAGQLLPQHLRLPVKTLMPPAMHWRDVAAWDRLTQEEKVAVAGRDAARQANRTAERADFKAATQDVATKERPPSSRITSQAAKPRKEYN